MANEKYKAISRNGEVRSERRILMESIIGRRLAFDEVVHHIDGDKSNNDPNNLMIVSRREHALIHREQIDRSKPVLQIKGGAVVSRFPSARAASNETKAAYQNICKCCRGLRKTAGGFGWRYAE